MGKVLIIGAGGVATVAAHKVAQHPEVFDEIMIASRTKAKCDAIVKAIGNPSIQTASNTFELDYAVMSVTGKKNIIETPLIGRKGSVKELISMGDYKISIAAFLQGEDGQYPEEKITRLREIININETIELISAFTDLLLDSEDKVVITDSSFPPTPGVEDGQAAKLELVTDKVFELTIE